MEDQVFTNAYQNVNDTTEHEITDFEEDKGDNLSDPIHEDPASPSSIATTLESMDSSQESSEDSRRNSVASRHGADGEDGSSLSHHGAEEDHPYQEMDPISPALEDKHVEGMMFESNTHFPPDIQLRRSQSISSNSSASLKFPPNNNFGETDNFQEDYEIFMFVKTLTVTDLCCGTTVVMTILPLFIPTFVALINLCEWLEIKLLPFWFIDDLRQATD
ncbi:uncharacterized protein FN964_003138 [Alca torda]